MAFYECKWRWYSRWCPREGHTVPTLSSQSLMLSHYTCTRIATFLLCSQGLQGFVCLTASSVWKGFDLSTNQLLWEVIHTFSQWVHRTTPGLAPWNVGAPFEQLLHYSLQLLTQKTLSWWFYIQPEELGTTNTVCSCCLLW